MVTETLHERLFRVADKLDIRESSVLDLLTVLSEQRTVENQELVRITGFPKTHLGRILQEFSDYLEPPSKRVVLRAQAIEPIRVFLNENGYKDNERTLRDQVTRVLESYRRERPTPDRSWDQFTATEETTVKRAMLMQEKGDLFNRRVAFLGDDDLTSVAVAMTKKTSLITVFEIDPRLVALLQKISGKLNLGIEVVEQDLRQPVSPENAGKYDVIFTDPPYTPGGISLFLSRGVELLRKRLSSRIYLCYGNSDRARERELEIQRIINNAGLLVSDKLAGFNKYIGAESIGSSSSLYLCDWTEKTKILPIDPKKIYTNQ